MRSFIQVAKLSLFNSAPGISRRGNSFATPNDTAHPLLYHVPSSSIRTVGRDTEVMSLWQNLLSGWQRQVLVGVDGIGKSTIATEFCDCARRSQRFSCIQWFNGRGALNSQLEHFFKTMKGRKEKDVLFVIDDVQNMEEALRQIPEHPDVYVLLTSSTFEGCSSANSMQMHVSRTPPLSPSAAKAFLDEMDSSQHGDLLEIYTMLGYVPLLLYIVNRLVLSSAMSSAELRSALEARCLMRDGALSISDALRVLLTFAIPALRKDFMDAPKYLAILSCFHLSDLSDAVVGAVVGNAAGGFAAAATQLGIFLPKWEDSAVALHPVVAKVLMEDVGMEELDAAAVALRDLWPRRWRGTGSHVAYNLVWHAVSLAERFAHHRHRPSEALVACMDRSATYLAHVERRDLPVATQLWLAVHRQHTQQHSEGGPVTPSMARIAMEAGRLLHYLRRPEAKEVLQAAYNYSILAHGKHSAESALAMGCLAPYLDGTSKNVDAITECVSTLEGKLSSVDTVLSKEERRMVLETIFVLYVCKGQILKEIGEVIPDVLWEMLDRTETQLKHIK